MQIKVFQECLGKLYCRKECDISPASTDTMEGLCFSLHPKFAAMEKDSPQTDNASRSLTSSHHTTTFNGS